MFTRDDYFDHPRGCHGYELSVADLDAQTDCDDVMSGLVRILDELGFKLGHRAEWSYACQCRGLYVDGASYERSPEPLENKYPTTQMWCDDDLVGEWMRHYYTLRGIWAAMTRFEDIQYELEWVDGLDYDAFDLLWDQYDSLHQRAVNLYESELEDALNDVCHAAERLMNDACEYRYSDEAADEWVSFRNEEEEWAAQQQAMRESEEMFGQTAKYETYAV